MGIGDVGLQAADHHPGQVLLVGLDASGEPLVVEQFQERRERFLEAVVRRRGEEEPVLEVRRERSDGLGAQAVDGVVAGARRRNVVRLVDDQKVELARVGRHWRAGVLA